MVWTLFPNLVSLAASAYMVFMAVSSIRSHAAENLEQIGLIVFGVPTLLVQLLVFVSLTYFYLKPLTTRHPEPRTRQVFVIIGWVPPAVTLAAIVIGVVFGGGRAQ